MNIYINIMIAFTLLMIIMAISCRLNQELPAQSKSSPPIPAFINMKTVSKGTDKKQIDNDAVAVLVKLGYNKVEATQRVVKVWDGIMGTQDTVKMALRTVI